MSEAKVRQSALASLARVEQSSQALRLKLRRKGYPDELIETVLEGLREQGLVDDERYARLLVDSGKRRGLGPRRLQHKLREQGIDSETIQSLLQSDWGDDAVRLAEQALQRGKQPAQIARWLAGRGFGSSEVRAALARAGQEL